MNIKKAFLKLFDKKPTFQDLFCYVSMKVFKNSSKIRGAISFFIKAKMYGVKCSGRVRCYGSVDINKAAFSEITFGKNVVLISDSSRATASSIYAPVKVQTFTRTSCISIGDGVSLNGTSIVARSKEISIGAGTMIAPNVTIMDSDFHALWPPERRAINPSMERDRDVIIGKNVWIGTKSTVLKGSMIGDNSIIGAGSVVVGKIPSNVIAAGIPAKVIKYLNDT